MSNSPVCLLCLFSNALPAKLQVSYSWMPSINSRSCVRGQLSDSKVAVCVCVCVSVCVCVCVSGQVSHESWEPAFLCAVLNPHGIDLISGLAVPRLSQSHCYSVCVCVGESVCLHVHTYLLFFFPSLSSCGNFLFIFL